MVLWGFNLVLMPPVPQPPPRRPVAYAEQHESDEEKQFRRVFQQLAGDVSDGLCLLVVTWLMEVSAAV